MTSPITVDPGNEIQNAIWKLFIGDPEINSLVNDILDANPDIHNYPTVVIDDPISTPDNTHDKIGSQIVIRVHTRVRGDIRSRNHRLENVIGSRICALLDHQHKALNDLVDGHTVYMVHFEERRLVPEKDRSVRHRIDRFRIWTTQD